MFCYFLVQFLLVNGMPYTSDACLQIVELFGIGEAWPAVLEGHFIEFHSDLLEVDLNLEDFYLIGHPAMLGLAVAKRNRLLSAIFYFIQLVLLTNADLPLPL